MVIVYAIIILTPFSQAQSISYAPTTSCEIRQSTWCILYSDVTYKDIPSREKGYASSWIVTGDTWKDYPLIINEPTGCRNGKSNTLDLVGSETSIRWQGRVWQKIFVRLKKDKSCDLEFVYPPVGQDPQEGAFLAAMTLVKSCSDQSCSSSPLGLFIRPKLDR